MRASVVLRGNRSVQSRSAESSVPV